ncbi:hypothetical protein GOBAR_AA20218 [Gossypium barbadense]|uniref:Uncharacterized protein n=1 Tax=Gossypium barbadense TaxID=3634 RepID=A0A2P5XAT5_GOSBA|nr:hypothetical protein GOBAR_AA20218 [Gossypium barbadense]
MVRWRKPFVIPNCTGISFVVYPSINRRLQDRPTSQIATLMRQPTLLRRPNTEPSLARQCTALQYCLREHGSLVTLEIRTSTSCIGPKGLPTNSLVRYSTRKHEANGERSILLNNLSLNYTLPSTTGTIEISSTFYGIQGHSLLLLRDHLPPPELLSTPASQHDSVPSRFVLHLRSSFSVGSSAGQVVFLHLMSGDALTFVLTATVSRETRTAISAKQST